MPYLISDKQSDCAGWATVKEESDGTYTTIGCHENKQDAIDQMVAISIAEDMEPGGEVSKRAVDLSLPSFIQENAKRGLEYLAEGYGGDGLTEGTKQAAREMAAGNITENKIRKMAPWFARHKVDGEAPKNSNQSDPGYPGAGLVAWLLWGGDSDFSDRAQNWAQRKIDALDAEEDSRSKMTKKIERRTFTIKNVEARQAEDGTMRLSGYAAVFNDDSVPLPFIERIAPGAFRKTLSETPDVRLLINHEGLPLARTKNGTLRLKEDEAGLYMDADLPDTQAAHDLYTLVERGDVDQMSFAFRVIRQKWNEGRTERTLTELSLADGDVSVVTYPAYPTTTVEAREQLKAAMQAVKEGRDISPETMLVLENIFADLSEGHEYIMKAAQIMSEFMAMEDSTYMDEEDRAVDTVGSFVSWDSSGGTARGRIEHVMREGVLGIPGTDFSITAEDDDPAVLIRIYEEFRDGWRATETLVGHKASTLTAINALPEPSPEESNRKISLRLAKAIVENTK
jgi:HK97 family phage prohead protease